MDGPRHCTGCNGPLCTACSSHALHALCPACSRKRNLPGTVVDARWMATLWWDAVKHGVPALHRSALPLLAVVAAVFSTGMPALSGGDNVPAFSGLLAQVGHLMESVLAVVLLCTLRTPSLAPPPLGTRVRRTLAVMLVVKVFVQGLVYGLALWVISGMGMEMLVVPLVAAGVVAGMVSAPLEGAVVLERSSAWLRLDLLRVAARPAGVVLVGVLLSMGAHSALLALQMAPLAMAGADAGPVFLLFVVVAQCLRLVLSTTFQLGAARFVMDAARVHRERV
jgi:hypothetical protein